MDYSSYQSPYSYRYGSAEMRHIWSEFNKRRLWRYLWVELAESLSAFGLVSAEEIADLHAHQEEIDISASLKIEKEIQHDLMAEVGVFASQCKLGGRVIHLGATSMDIKDNTDALLILQSMNLLLTRLRELLLSFAELIQKTADLPCIALTHLQPAEPTTYGYRFASILQDLEMDFQALTLLKGEIKGKGFKGAVGNAASFIELLNDQSKFYEFEKNLSEKISLPFFQIATQTYTRKQESTLINCLANLAATVYKAALDLRLLQSAFLSETLEPFGSNQVGSSAMPFKRNPIQLEKIDSLARLISTYPSVAWGNYAHSILERTLDDSANRRTLLPESFLIIDEILLGLNGVIKGLNIKNSFIQANLDKFAPFSATEKVMLLAVKNGADRQLIHERLREHAMTAWHRIEQNLPGDLQESIMRDPVINQFLSPMELEESFNIKNYLGLSISRSRELAQRVFKQYQSA